MGKLRKQRKTKKYNYNKDRKKAWKKSKKLPNIECLPIKNAWDSKKSVRQNLSEMGLSADPNQTLKIPKTKDFLSVDEEEETEAVSKIQKPEKQKSSKKHVVEELETEANVPLKKTLRLSEPEVNYCIYMMNKYGEDFKAMAKDRRNYYQETPKQIKKKIQAFKSIPAQYNKYLASRSTSSECLVQYEHVDLPYMNEENPAVSSSTEMASSEAQTIESPNPVLRNISKEAQPVDQSINLPSQCSHHSEKTVLANACITPPSKLSHNTEQRILSSAECVTPPCTRMLRMPQVMRRVTRTYQAKRRNGHYLTPTLTSTPIRPKEVANTKKNEVPFHKVRRRLSFGRKPPVNRNTDVSDSQEVQNHQRQTVKSEPNSKSANRIQRTSPRKLINFQSKDIQRTSPRKLINFQSKDIQRTSPRKLINFQSKDMTCFLPTTSGSSSRKCHSNEMKHFYDHDSRA